jgi:hypothetical protein
MPSRKLFVGGNWKSNGTVKSGQALLKALKEFKYDTSKVKRERRDKF